jgi:hypothetical protein
MFWVTFCRLEEKEVGFAQNAQVPFQGEKMIN